MEETLVKPAFFWGECGYFLSQRVGIQALSWPRAGHDGQTFPGAPGAKPVPEGRELGGDQQISAGFGAISAGAGAGEKSGPFPLKGRTSPSWGGICIKNQCRPQRNLALHGKGCNVQWGKKALPLQLHRSDPLARPCCPGLPHPVPLQPLPGPSLPLLQPLPSSLLFGMPSPPTSTCFCHLGEAVQVPASTPLPGVNAGQPTLLGLNGASSKYTGI